MSAGPGRREVAHRVFAAEYDDASLEYAESDEERAPNYVVTPGGARINRLFVVGVLTSVEQVNDDTVRARIADPTGAFVVYAGQYQPDELAALQSIEAPAFVAVTGKANAFTPDGSDRVLTSVRPESVTEVDAETRDRWVVTTAEHTLARVQTFGEALDREERGDALTTALHRDGVEPGFAEGVAKAIEHYGTTADYLGALRELALQAVEVVAGEREEASGLDLAPDESDGSYAPGDLRSLLEDERPAAIEAAGEPPVVAGEDGSESGTQDEPTQDEATQEEAAQADAASETDATTDAANEPATDEPDVETGTGSGGAGAGGMETGAESDAGSGAESDTGSKAESDAGTETEADGTSDPATPSSADAEDDESASDVPADAPGDDSEDGEADDSAVEDTPESASDGEPADGFEVDDDEREQIEEEYGVGFQNGTEVDEPGEADIEPEAGGELGGDGAAGGAGEGGGEAEADAGTTGGAATDDGPTGVAGTDESDPETDDDDPRTNESDGEDADAVDIETTLLAEMEALDDGDGADRDALIDAVVAETGVDAAAVDDAIDEALMSGQCYEPSEGTLKSI